MRRVAEEDTRADMNPDASKESLMDAAVRRDMARIWLDLLSRSRLTVIFVALSSLMPPMYCLIGHQGGDGITRDGNNGAMRARRNLPVSRKLEATALWFFAVVVWPTCGFVIALVGLLLIRLVPSIRFELPNLEAGLLCACLACMVSSAIILGAYGAEPAFDRLSNWLKLAFIPLALLLVPAIIGGPLAVLLLVAAGNAYELLAWILITLFLPALPISYRLRLRSMRSMQGSRERGALRTLKRFDKPTYKYESQLRQYLTGHLRAFSWLIVWLAGFKLYTYATGSNFDFAQILVLTSVPMLGAFGLLSAFIYIGSSIRPFRALPMSAFALSGLLHGTQLMSCGIWTILLYVALTFETAYQLPAALSVLGIGAWLTWCIPLQLRIKRRKSPLSVLAVIWMLFTFIACITCITDFEQSTKALAIFAAAGWAASPLAVLWTTRLLRRNSAIYRSSPAGRLDLSNVPQE